LLRLLKVLLLLLLTFLRWRVIMRMVFLGHRQDITRAVPYSRDVRGDEHDRPGPSPGSPPSSVDTQVVPKNRPRQLHHKDDQRGQHGSRQNHSAE